jgi:hypothetical protein
MHRSNLNNWLPVCALLPAIALAQEPPVESAPATAGAGDPPVNWVDTSHSYATNKAQALTLWMDRFFGDPEYNIEQAESWLRLESELDWDQEDGSDMNLRLRGKVQLPRISKRLDLIFSDEDNEQLDREDRELEDRVGLQLNMRQSARSRFDLTLGFNGSGPRPGVRYRASNAFSEKSNYRFTQRFQYESDEGFYSLSQLDLNRALDSNSLLRWSNRALYGEDSLGVEWRSRLNLRHRLLEHTKRPLVLSYYAVVNGVTRPEQWVRNYRLGILLRRQIYRDFLFFEIEPSINYRRRQYEDDRDFALGIIGRLEIALEKDLRRIKPRKDDRMRPVESVPEEQREAPIGAGQSEDQ